MSTERGNSTTPGTPVFATEQGQPSKILEIKNVPLSAGSLDDKSYSVTRKGYAPGTFVIGGFKNPMEKERPVIQGVPRPRVGNEARNKELEEITRTGRLAREAGIDFETDEKGNVKVILPEELLQSSVEDDLKKEENERREQLEKELAEKAEKEQERNDLLKQMIPVSIEFATLKTKAEDLIPIIKDQKGLTALMALVSDGEGMIAAFRNDPSADRLQAFKEKVADLRNALAGTHAPSQAQGEESGKTKLLEDILQLTLEIDAEMEEARVLEEHISDSAKLTEFKNAIKRIKMLFTSVRNSKDEDIKKQFEVEFANYKNTYKKEVEDFIAKHPLPVGGQASAAVPAASPSALAATPASSQAAPHKAPTPLTPEQIEKLKVGQGWPEDKVFKKEGEDKNRNGWYMKDRGDERLLPNQDRWETEHKHFASTFEEYSKLTTGLPPEDIQRIKPLIETKNRLVEAVRKFNINAVTAERKRFEASLSKWKKSLALQKTLESFERTSKAAEKAKESFEHAYEGKHLDAEKEKVEQLYGVLKQASLSGIAVKEEDVTKLKTLIEGYKKLVETYEAKNKKLGRDILRPIRVTDANRNKIIKSIGRPDMTLGEYEKQTREKEQHANTVEITDEMLSRWHELAGQVQVGDVVDKKELEKMTVFITYDRMFRKNENAFLSLYSTPEYDQTENGVRYVTNRRFQMGTTQEQQAISDIFKAHGLRLVDQTSEGRSATDHKKAEEEKALKPSYKETFRPVFHEKKSFLGIPYTDAETNVMKRADKLGIVEQMATPTVFADIEEYESLRNQRARLAVNHPSFDREEENLDAIITDLKNAPDDERLYKEFGDAFAAYKEKVMPFIEGRKEERVLGSTLEERKWRLEENKKKAEALKKIDAILNRRIEEAIKKVEMKSGETLTEGSGRIRVALATLLLATGTYYALNNTAPAKAEQAPQKIEQVLDTIDHYVAERARPLQKDIDANMSVRDLVAKYNPLSINKDKPASIDNILHMEAVKCMKMENAYGLHDDQQKEVCDFIFNLQNIHEAVFAPSRTKALSLGIPYELPNDLPPGAGMTIEDYMQKVIKRYKDAHK